MTTNKYVYDAGSGSFHRKRKERPRADDSELRGELRGELRPGRPNPSAYPHSIGKCRWSPHKEVPLRHLRRSLLRVEYGRNRAHRGQECTDCAAAAASAGTKVCRGCLRAKPKDDFTLTEFRRKHPLCAECARKQRTTGAVRLQPSRRKS